MASPPPSPPTHAAGRRVPPPCWTPEETQSLARAYTARRLAVGRAHLTSADWAAVAAAATPSKTARQCRHKVEKLRRRLRSKKRRPCPVLDGIDLLDDPSSSPSRSHSPSPPPPASPPSPPKKRKRPYDDGGEGDVAQALRAIGDGFVRAELRRMEADREAQRMRMDMALRQLDAQRRLLEGLVGRIVDALD